MVPEGPTLWSNNMAMSIYLAGPFFNAEQRALVRELEKGLEQAGHNVWSPSRDGIALPPNASDAEQRRVFELNFTQINQCDVMVAILEPNDPRPVKVAVSAFEDHVSAFDAVGEDISPFDVDSFEIDAQNQVWPQYSDTGTVWEMGAAYMAGKAVVGYYDVGAKRPNLMLAKSCRGIAFGGEQLLTVIETVRQGGSVEYRGEIT